MKTTLVADCVYLQNNNVCECRHNTEGDNCDRCEPLYNSELWRMATDIDPAHCMRELSLSVLISIYRYTLYLYRSYIQDLYEELMPLF